MSVNLWERRCHFGQRPVHVSRFVVDGRKRRDAVPRIPLPDVSDGDDEDRKFVVRSAMWIAVLGVMPLMMFYIISFFYPDFLCFPVTPD